MQPESMLSCCQAAPRGAEAGQLASRRVHRLAAVGLGLLALLVPVALAPAQAPPGGMQIERIDGKILHASSVTSADGSTLKLTTDLGTQEVRTDEVLGIHTAVVAATNLPRFCLAGGDVLCGELAGGDGNGQWFEVLSPTLGRVRAQVDRLAYVLLRPALARPRDLRLPDGVHEALFQKAAIGLDTIAGTLHQFGDDAVLFATEGKDKPTWFKVQDLVGLAMADPALPKTPPVFEVLTRAGDRVSGKLARWADGTLTIASSDRADLTIKQADLACATALGPAVVFLSTLPPAKVEENGFEGDVLYPFQKDRNALGGPLQAGGLAYSRGLGVHSHCRLTFVVPAGMQGFMSLVGMDDSAMELPLRSAAEVTVNVDEKQVFHVTVTAGQPPQGTGIIPVHLGQQLVLDVDFGHGRDLGDRVDWLGPVFLVGVRRE
jgi:NPCBM/NEW2 domain